MSLRGSVFTLDSNEHYINSRNLALPQDLHSLRGSTRGVWAVNTRLNKYEQKYFNYCKKFKFVTSSLYKDFITCKIIFTLLYVALCQKVPDDEFINSKHVGQKMTVIYLLRSVISFCCVYRPKIKYILLTNSSASDRYHERP
jgi:hypothetical protein